MSLRDHLLADTVEETDPIEPLTVAPETSCARVLERLLDHSDGCALVVRDGAVAGIFTERDAVRLMAAGADLCAPVGEVMVRDPVTVGAGTRIADAIRIMSRGGYRRLPIVDPERRPIGVVKVSGIVHYLVEYGPGAVYNVPPDPDAPLHDREGA